MRTAALAAALALLAPGLARAADAFFVEAVRLDGGRVRLEVENLETGKPQRLTLPADGPLVDLAAAGRTEARSLVPGGLLFSGEGGQPPTWLPPGKRVNRRFAEKDPERSGDIDRLAAKLAPRARALREPVAAASDPKERDLRAFLFVLEFALGAPFTVAQEETIHRAALAGGTDGQAFAGAAGLVPALLALDEGSSAGLQAELRKVVDEWLGASDAKDPAVRAVREQLASRGKVVAAGKPPLTEMAAASYAEVWAYSRALQADPDAPAQALDAQLARSVRAQVIERWGRFSAQEREAVATLPGRWVVLRRVLEFGTAEERARVRSSLRAIAAAEEAPAAGPTKPAADLARAQLEGWSRLQMQQMTFNHYMWSRGFNYSPVYGKMW